MNYIIEYEVKSLLGATLSKGKIRAKNKASEFAALVGTREHLERSVPNAREVIIIDCRREANKATEDFIDMFNDTVLSGVFGGFKK